MDTKVENAVVMKRDHGMIPESAVTFVTERPTTTPLDGQRIAYLRFKEIKGTKRESMAVAVTKHDCEDDGFTGVRGHEFLNGLLAEFQDVCLRKVADGDLKFEVVNTPALLVEEYFDTSRDGSGRKVTKESIAEWFLTECGAYVTGAALLKNAQMTEETLQKLLAGYAEMFARLTKYDLANIYAENQIALVKKILANVPSSGSEMREWVDTKVAKIIDAMTKVADLVDAI